MKQINNTIAVLAIVLLSSISAFAQVDTTKTAYGVKLNDNYNLRFTKADKVHTEVSLGAHYSGGDYSAYGVDLSLRRRYTPGVAGWSYGALVSEEYSKEFGMNSSFAAMLGVHLGNKVSFGIDALAGYGQTHRLIDSWKVGTEKTHEYKNTDWRPFAGGQAEIRFSGKRVAFSLWGRYTHTFVSEGEHLLDLPEGWESKQTTYADRWAIGASLSINISKEAQVSGDNCWMGGVYGGYAFGDNSGAVVGANLLHYTRTSVRSGYILGFGTEYTMIDSDNTANKLYGQAAYVWHPYGSDSKFALELGGRLGMGEFAKAEEGATENGKDFTMKTNVFDLGFSGEVYAAPTLRMGRHSIKAQVNFGGYVTAGTNFSGDKGYDGKTSSQSGVIGSVTLGYSLSF